MPYAGTSRSSAKAYWKTSGELVVRLESRIFPRIERNCDHAATVSCCAFSLKARLGNTMYHSVFRFASFAEVQRAGTCAHHSFHPLGVHCTNPCQRSVEHYATN